MRILLIGIVHIKKGVFILMTRIAFFAIAVALSMLVACNATRTTIQSGSTPEMVTSIDGKAVVETLGYQLKRVSLISEGWVHDLVTSGIESPDFIVFSVFPSVFEAESSFDSFVGRMTIGPKLTDVGIGDRSYIWHSDKDKGNTALFRRDNVFVRIAWKGSLEGSMAVARKIDDMLKENKGPVKRGVLQQKPEIKDIPAYVDITPAGLMEIHPIVTGFGRNKPTIFVGAAQLGRGKATIQEDGIIKIVADDRPGRYRLEIGFGSKDTLLFTKRTMGLEVREEQKE